MALAETASIFCETIVCEAGAARRRPTTERLAILETSLQAATQVVVDIHSRFLFESRRVRAPRRERELSVASCAS